MGDKKIFLRSLFFAITALSLFGIEAARGASDSGAAFFNPISVDSLEDLIQNLLDGLYGFVVGLSILMIVLGGVFYMLSGANPKMLERAKNCWTSAVIGFAIVVAAPTFLRQIVEILGTTANNVDVDDAKSLSEIIADVLDVLLSLLGMLCIISLTIAGGLYMTAYGDDKRIGTAKTIAKYSIIGLVVALSSLVAINGIDTLIEGY